MKTKLITFRLNQNGRVPQLLSASLIALTLAVLVSSCTTNGARREAPPAKTGVVCPECRTVVLGPFPSSSDWRGGPPSYTHRHTCSGCQGVITIYGEEEQFQHECSVCKQSPYSCRITH